VSYPYIIKNSHVIAPNQPHHSRRAVVYKLAPDDAVNASILIRSHHPFQNLNFFTSFYFSTVKGFSAFNEINQTHPQHT
jgi:hypothetical protein